MSAWFASDLHLGPATPATTRRFIHFLAGPARDADSLFLLGDLFEAWIGDDDPDSWHREVVGALSAVSAHGTLVYLMHGNRDFLIGQRFCAETGGMLLADPAVVTLGGTRVLLCHGDGLCVDDRSYQRLRALVRDERVRRRIAALPPATRRRLAGEARAGSREYQALAGGRMADVSHAAVLTLLRAAQARVLIHGHTHRPGVHGFEIDGTAATRIVLGAWQDGAEVLHWDAAGYRLRPCPC